MARLVPRQRQSSKVYPLETKAEPLVASVLPTEVLSTLTRIDDRLVEVLARGDIRLVRVAWLHQQAEDFIMPYRQQLEAMESAGASPSPLLSPEEAVELIRRGDRSVGALTYGWVSPSQPDPRRIRVIYTKR